MEKSPSKRRKTSATSSVAANVSNTELHASNRHGDRPSSSRASFMSPTKASLARFNPDLLPRNDLAESQRPSSSGGPGLSTRVFDGKSIGNRTREKGEIGGVTNPAVVDIGLRDGYQANSHEVLREDPKRKLQGHSANSTPSRRPLAKVAPNPPASPPRGADDIPDETAIEMSEREPLTGQEAARSLAKPVSEGSAEARLPETPIAQRIVALASGMQADDDEPSLPSTPTQLGLEKPPEKPKGLHFYNSPSKRRRKEKPNKSSPLKPIDAAPQTSLSLGPKIYIANTPRQLVAGEQVEYEIATRRLHEIGTQLKSQQDALSCQLLQSYLFQDDPKWAKSVSRSRREIGDKVRAYARSSEEAVKLHSLSNNGDLGTTFEKTFHGPMDTSSNSSTLTQRLASFLPFITRPSLSIPRPPAMQLAPDNQNILENTASSVQSIPFTAKTAASVILPIIADGAVLLQQDLEFTSSEQGSIVKLRLVLDPSSQSVSSIELTDVAPWVSKELGACLRLSSEPKQISYLGTAIGHFMESSYVRARCWHEVRGQFRNLLRGPSHPSGVAAFQTSDLGCSSITLVRSSLTLELRWHISITEEGKAQDHVSAIPSFSRSWDRADKSGELTKIGDAFDMLIQERGVSRAIHDMCALLFPP